jgi:predicted phage-related endonuclease
MGSPETLHPDRTRFIGGSDVGPLLGVSPWKTPFQLYQQKIGAWIEEITPAKQRILDRGHRWEPIVLEMLVDELCDRGHQVEVVATGQRYIDPELPFLACEIDAELIVDGEPVNGEMKTANHFAAAGWGAYDAEDIPIYYAAQGMHGLMIRPRRRVVFAAVTGFDERPMIRWMERDEETIAAIRAKEIAFWQRVQNLDPPDPETAEDVKWLYQRDAGLVLEADSDLMAWCQDLKDLKAHAKAHEAEIELLATRIKARMGDAATLVGPDGKPIATWRNNKDSVKTDWKAVAASLNAPAEVIADHTTTTPGARPLLIK